MPNIKYMKKI